MKIHFGAIEFDLLTAFMTILIIPIIIGLLVFIRKHALKILSFLVDFGAHYISRYIKKEVLVYYTLKQYCRYCLSLEAYKYMLIPSSKDISLLTDDTYVPLILETDLKQSTISDSELIAEFNRIRIFGDPGSGKSTLIKKLFRMLCRRTIISNSKFSMPIIIELRQLTNLLNNDPIDSSHPSGTWLLNQVFARAQMMEIYGINDCFDAMIKNNGIVVFLDGLDEISSKYEDCIINEINGLSVLLSNKSPHNKIVITMRTQYHHITRSRLSQEYPHALHLRPFSLDDIYTFLENWPFRKDQEQSTTRIYSQLGDHPSLRDLCRNPLILSMYVAEDQSSEFLVAPDSRTSFYSKIISELLLKRRMRQTGPRVAYSKLKDLRESILGRIAYLHLLDENQSSNSISWKMSIDLVSAYMNVDENQAQNILHEIATETGIIAFEQPFETLRFIHLSICEYFAAYEAVNNQDNGWSEVTNQLGIWYSEKKKNNASRLMEVVPFTCGLMKKSERNIALSEIHKLSNSTLTMKCFLETKTYDIQLWTDFVNIELERIKRLLENDVNEYLLQEFYLFLTALRDANINNLTEKEVSWPEASKVVIDLIAIYKSKVRSLLVAYAQQDGVSALRVASLAGLNTIEDFPEILAEACEQAPALAWIISYIRSNPDDVSRYARLLMEMALRKKIVARWLIYHKPIKEINNGRKYNPQNMNGCKYSCLNNTLYGQLLELCTSNDRTMDESNVLGFVMKLKTQKEYVFRIIHQAALAPLVILVILFTMNVVVPLPSSIVEITAIASLYSLLIYIFQITIKLYVLDELFRDIFNINIGSRLIMDSSNSGYGGYGKFLIFGGFMLLTDSALRIILKGESNYTMWQLRRRRLIHSLILLMSKEIKEVVEAYKLYRSE